MEALENNVYKKNETAFIVKNETEDLNGKFTLQKENGVLFLFGRIKEDGLFYPYMKDIGTDIKELLINATKNMRKKHPCSIIKLDPKTFPIEIESEMKEMFAATSTSVYYGADALADFSKKIEQELYVFQLNEKCTLLCGINQMDAETAKEAFEKVEGRLGKEALVFTKENKLVALSNWQAQELNIGKVK